MKTNEMIGALIRKERNRRNWSLAGLAKDICAVSYLSKIEQGKADCSEEVLKLLFAKLSIDWHTDPVFLHQAETLVRRMYESIFAMEDIVFSAGEKELLDEMEYSMYVIDAMLIEAWTTRKLPAEVDSLAQYMDERQLCLVYLLEERYEEALRVNPCALTYYYAGMDGYNRGDNYERAMQLLQKAYSLASDEGLVYIMFQSALLMGNLAGNLLDVHTMMQQYTIAERLARALGYAEDLRTMQYNKAAVWIEAGRAEDAYQYFCTLENPSVMERHKYAIAAELSRIRGTMTEEELSTFVKEMEQLPDQITRILEDKDRIQWFAAKFSNAKDVFFIGRGLDYAISMEGSLKLKEISYIHSEAYAAGELKHGTISLIEEGTLVIGICTQKNLFEKTRSNMVETGTRGAYLMGLTSYGNYSIEDTADFTVYVPRTDEHLMISLAIVPLQLLAYYLSVAKGLNVDKPRNLAKSVTVE